MNITRTIPRIAFCCCRFYHGRVLFRIVACAILLALFSSPRPAAAANTAVRMEITYGTNHGTIDLQLRDDVAPQTVMNFLRYAGRGDYSTNGIIYRSVPGFVIQTGGYSYSDLTVFGALYRYYFHVPKDPPVLNEFALSNTLGTIAMAKLPGYPDSATSDWFINLADNHLNLDYQNGGFTVFGYVIDTASDPGMNVVNAIANLPTVDASSTGNPPVTCSACNLPISAFNTLPVINYNSTTGLDPSNLVLVTSIPNITATKTLTTGTTSAYAADLDVTLSNPNSNKTVDAVTSSSWLQAFTPPPGKSVQFNDEISRFTMTWPAGSSATRVVTLYHGAATNVNGYYAYGPTPGNPSPHWYNFSYDGTTGAEFVGNQILLHFVDGQRGDDDLTTIGSITHTGAPALVTDTASVPTTSAGCSIAAAPSQMRGNGDWIVVAMFLAFVAVIRKRTRRIGRVGIAHRK
ncbi:MAG: peptidylprolyl isomerase [Sulfuricaulis sp.]